LEYNGFEKTVIHGLKKWKFQRLQQVEPKDSKPALEADS
jgi:hypothetical protein